jgi:hypothetical protein
MRPLQGVVCGNENSRIHDRQMTRILLIDDDAKLTALLGDYLVAEGFSCT